MTILAKKGFISSKPVSSISNARLRAGIYYSRERRQAVFPIKQKTPGKITFRNLPGVIFFNFFI